MMSKNCDALVYTYDCTAVAPLTDESIGEIPLLVILIFCLFGVILVILNVLLIVFLIRRRRKKFHKGMYRFIVITCSCYNTVS